MGISRRRVLAGSGGALTTLLAGCGTLPFVDDGTDGDGSTDWPMDAHDARNTNRTMAALPDEPTEQWRTGFDVWLEAFVADDTAYVASLAGDESGNTATLHALDVGTGDEKWTKALPDHRPFYSRPVVGDDAVIYGSYAGTDTAENASPGVLHVRDAEMGEQRWQSDAPANIGWPTVDNDTVLTAGTHGRNGGWIGAFEAASSDLRWGEDLDARTFGPPATDGDVVVAITNLANVIALDLESGERLWTRFDDEELGFPQVLVPPALGDETIYAFLRRPDSPTRTLYALDYNGETVWQRPVSGMLPGNGSPMAFFGLADERILCLMVDDSGDPTTRLTAFDRASGDEQWTYTVSSDGRHPTGQLTLTRDSALFAADGRLHAVSLAGEKRWERPVDQVASTKPIVADDRLYLNVTAADEEGASLAAFA